MRTLNLVPLLAAAAGLSLSLAGGASACDGRAEVEAAFAKQQKTKGWRSVVESETNAGKQEQTTDYVPPDRMRRKILVIGQEPAVETISISKWAWSNQGGGWGELKPPMAKMMNEQLTQMLSTPPKAGADFTCLGNVPFDGKDYVAYQTTPEKGQDGSEVARTIYVDGANGLPAFNIIAELKPQPKQLVRETFSYPDDISVEKP